MNAILSKKNIILIILLFAGAAVFAAVYIFGVRPATFLGGGDQEKANELETLNRKISDLRKKLDELGELTPEELRELEEKQKTLAALEATEDVAVSGIKITKKGDRKLIENNEYGYSIELPEDLILARSISPDFLEFHSRDLFCRADPSCPAVIEIVVRGDNPKNLSIGEWLAKEEESASDQIYSPREEMIIGDLTAYRVTESIPRIFEGFYYYFAKAGFIYSIRVSAEDDSKYRGFINTFRFR